MKKLLLIFAITLLSTYSLLAQVPANDLIQNATLVNSFPFADNNVRLDLASDSAGGQSGCTLSGWPVVFYKFTAASSIGVQITIEDASSQAISSSLAVFFTAPNLNITSETQLTLVSACATGSYTKVTLVEGLNYYLLVGREDAGALSNISIDTFVPLPTSERDALSAIYNSTNGDTWNDSSWNNWNTNWPIDVWRGVITQVINGVEHVTKLALGNNNLTGTLPAEIGDFPELTHLWLWSNQLTGNIPPEIGDLTNLIEMDLSPNTFTGSIPTEIGNLVNLEILWLNQNGLSGSIPTSFQNLTKLRELHLRGSAGPPYSSSAFSGDFPDLTALPLELLDLKTNFFQFSDIVDEFATYEANIPDFTFNPQYTVDAAEEIVTDPGADITLTLTDVSSRSKSGSSKTNLAGNTYQWFKNDVAITNANSDTYTITNAQTTDSGYYYCEITNTDVPGMIIQRQIITVNIGGGLGLGDYNMDMISIYPNPTNNVLNIKLNKHDNATLVLHDVSGRLILEQKLKSKVSTINLDNLQSGMYLLQIKTEGKTFATKRIIKQ